MLSEDAAEKLTEYFESVEMSKIGNGRGARNLFEKAITQEAKRLERISDQEIDLQTITVDDIDIAIRRG